MHTIKRTNALGQYSPNLFSWVAFFDSGRAKDVTARGLTNVSSHGKSAIVFKKITLRSRLYDNLCIHRPATSIAKRIVSNMAISQLNNKSGVPPPPTSFRLLFVTTKCEPCTLIPDCPVRVIALFRIVTSRIVPPKT